MFLLSILLNSTHLQDFIFAQPSSDQVSSCDLPATPKHIAVATFVSIVLIFGVFGNLLVIFVIQYSQLRKKPGYVLITSLAAADLGVSLFVTSPKVHLYLQNENFCSDLSFCVFRHVTDSLFPTASITHLLFICLNKFWAVQSPYKYHNLVKHSREIVVVVCVWVYCLLWTAAGMVRWDAPDPEFSVVVFSNGVDRMCYSNNSLFYVCAVICVFVLPVLVAGLLYIVLLFVVAEKMNSIPTCVGEGTPAASTSESASLRNTTSPTQQRRVFTNTKGVKTLMAVFAGWVVCWMPHFSLVLVNHWNMEILYRFQEEHEWLSVFIGSMISDVLPCLNSCINPFIYFKTSCIFRHSLQDSYLKLMKKPRHRAGSNSLRRLGKSASLDTVVRYGVAGAMAAGSEHSVTFLKLRPNS